MQPLPPITAGPDGNQVNATATGGAGGAGAGGGFASGNGGNATAVAISHSSSLVGFASNAFATATSGASSAPTDSASFGIGGTASASASTDGVTILQLTNPGPGGAGGVASVGSAWTFLGGATVFVGFSNVNNSSVTVTGSSAFIAGITGSGTLTIGNGASATTLRLTPYSGVSSESSLSIKAGSALDIINNHLFINYGANADPISTIAGYLKSGYNGGAWNGTGIDSSAVAINANYAIGYADAADPGNPAGLSSGGIEVKYTLYGDTNLDGTVNSIDFGALAANFGRSGKVWDQGDFNYDGVVNSIDFGFWRATSASQPAARRWSCHRAIGRRWMRSRRQMG